MRIATIGQAFDSRACMNRKESKIARDLLEVEQHRIEIRNLDMLENVDATHEVGGSRIAVFGKCRVVGKIVEVSLAELMQRAPQVALSGAIVADRLRAELLHERLDRRCIAD